MNVGILTFHNAYNYGAVLQAYATQVLVESLGHKAEVIDYHNTAIDNDYNMLKFHYRSFIGSKYKFPLYLLDRYFFWKRRKSFRKFQDKYIKLSSKTYFQCEDVSFYGYDIVLIGSDQLWNKSLTGGLDKIYWGQFDTIYKTRKVAWSVCMNNTNLSDHETSLIMEYLKDFYAISVREETLQAFISKLTNNRVWHTLDPTLLLSSEKWEEVCHPVKESNYIAVYAVKNEKETIRFARKLASSLNKKIIILRSYSKWYFSSDNKEYCGPDEFLSYIRNADYVVTSSFHGTVFSLIFRRQFICPRFDGNIRVEDLLHTVGLSSRFVRDWKEVLSLLPINYNNLSDLLEIKRKETINFLSKILN